MKFNSLAYCHWDLFKFIKEHHITEEDITLSIIDGEDIELMIFLAKKENCQEYEVRVYTTESEFDYFEFKHFDLAHEFVDTLTCTHPEYIKRPSRKISKDNYSNM